MLNHIRKSHSNAVIWKWSWPVLLHNLRSSKKYRPTSLYSVFCSTGFFSAHDTSRHPDSCERGSFLWFFKIFIKSLNVSRTVFLLIDVCLLWLMLAFVSVVWGWVVFQLVDAKHSDRLAHQRVLLTWRLCIQEAVFTLSWRVWSDPVPVEQKRHQVIGFRLLIASPWCGKVFFICCTWRWIQSYCLFMTSCHINSICRLTDFPGCICIHRKECGYERSRWLNGSDLQTYSVGVGCVLTFLLPWSVMYRLHLMLKTADNN